MTKLIRSARFVISRICQRAMRGGKKEIYRKGCDLATVLGAKPPSFRGDTPNGSCRTLLHHPHRPCVRPESCVRHSLRVKSTDARHPVFFFHFLPPTTRARCVSERMRSFPLSCARINLYNEISDSTNTRQTFNIHSGILTLGFESSTEFQHFIKAENLNF